MQIILTVKHASEGRAYDVEVPATMTFGEIAAVLAEKLGWGLDASGLPLPCEVEAIGLGRRLRHDETPARVDIADGAWLIFHPLPAASPQAYASAPPPLTPRRPLQTMIPQPTAPPPPGWAASAPPIAQTMPFSPGASVPLAPPIAQTAPLSPAAPVSPSAPISRTVPNAPIMPVAAPHPPPPPPSPSVPPGPPPGQPSATSVPNPPSAPTATPFGGWKPLDLAAAPPTAPTGDTSSPPAGLPWRRIDTDE